jgi:hypothetical protein
MIRNEEKSKIELILKILKQKPTELKNPVLDKMRIDFENKLSVLNNKKKENYEKS